MYIKRDNNINVESIEKTKSFRNGSIPLIAV